MSVKSVKPKGHVGHYIKDYIRDNMTKSVTQIRQCIRCYRHY